uniref:UvrD-helicase domain-containing protein n=1 Tax=Marinobacterium profundum TaxID=1714300 RepID=UPI0009E69F0E|nr:UvrD-helicase domain-containing protein [Marinobacterium profundum]
MTEQIFRPHWLVRQVGVSWRNATLCDAGLVLVGARGAQPETVSWEQLLRVPALQKGVLFHSVVLTTAQGDRILSWLSRSRAAALQGTLEANWYLHHASAASERVNELRRLLGRPGYLRTGRWLEVKRRAAKALASVTALPAQGVVDDKARAPYLQLKRWADWDESQVQLIRDRYVARQKERFQALFDGIESNPLTERQREACIIDDDNNLVLAGAGTGKTSTLVGRAVYLIKSAQARPADILLLAYGSKAAQEMRERLHVRLDNDGVAAKTFHALGQLIITEVEGAKPRISALAEDAKALASQVDSWFQQLLQQDSYRRLALTYFQYYLYPAKNPFDFKSEGEYFEYLTANEIRTFKGEAVKSYEECLIANWLFRMGVGYVYEDIYHEAQTKSPDFRTYQPDFYLPDYGIYIEHFGIDRQGNTAPYIDREQYLASMQWKRELHETHQTTMIETFHYERREGRLLENLQAKLEAQQVAFSPLPDAAVLETLREFGAISRFSELLSQLLGRYKNGCFNAAKLQQIIAGSAERKQLQAAMTLLQPVLELYQDLLSSRDEIDFDDMIGRALAYVQDGRFKPRWRFILVDEFQDISEPRARLVKALHEAHSDCSLFCVGDDWQAIYRFSGSDVGLTSGFNHYFGPGATTVLDKTFRFNSSIGEVASRFVMRNPAQVPKQLKAHEQVNQPAVSLMRRSRDPAQPWRALEDVLRELAQHAKPGSSVYLLARFWFRLPDSTALRALNRDWPKLNIEALSLHAAKGKEADYVIILGLESGKHGFPSEKLTHPLLEALLPAAEPYEFAEERRLFYVSLTRARHRVFLVCDMVTASKFVIELQRDQYPIELNEFETSLAQRLYEAIKCSRCETGSMVARRSTFGDFFGCSNYPRCDHREKGCPECGLAMKKSGRFKVCIDDSCSAWVPLCPLCGADMAQRSGRFGTFWGCGNYRGKENPSSGHTENEISTPLIEN